jgi:glycosyltransferase involved in cell wall biosynthesis
VRVGWVIDGSLEQLSGGYLYDRIVVDYLRRHAVEVAVLSLPTGSYGSRLARGLRSEAEHLIAAASPDVLVQDELSHPALIRSNRRLARSRPGLMRVGLVHHLRSSEPRSFLANAVYRQIERRYLASVDAFIFNSRATRASVERLGLAASPSVVALPGADRLPVDFASETIDARARAAGPLRVLFLGNLIPRKGLLTLVEAVALLPAGSVRVTVVGSTAPDPGHTRRVRRRIAVLRLTAAVHFLGPLDQQDLSQVMLDHHVLAMPSAYEGYGMAYLEGMGHGLPAIAGCAGGAGEFVRDGENGFLVQAGDPAGLAVHLANLDADRARLARLALAARKTYLAHPSWEDTGGAVLAFLASLVQAVNPQPASVPRPPTCAILNHPERRKPIALEVAR